MTSIIPTQQYRTYLEGWGIWLTVIATANGTYYVLRELCEAIGIADYRQQYQKLLTHEDAAQYVVQLPVETESRGKQRTYCLHHRILGGWLYMVSPRYIRAEFRSRLTEFHNEADYALNRIIFGEVDSAPAPLRDAPATITKLSDWMGRPRDPIQLSPPAEDE